MATIGLQHSPTIVHGLEENMDKDKAQITSSFISPPDSLDGEIREHSTNHQEKIVAPGESVLSAPIVSTTIIREASEITLNESSGSTEINTTMNPYTTKVLLEHVSVDTLKTYSSSMSWSHDEDPKYVIIHREVPDYEMEFLKRHTQELQIKHAKDIPNNNLSTQDKSSPPLDVQSEQEKNPRMRVPHPPPPPPQEYESLYNEPLTEDEKDPLLIQINYVPFENWLKPWDETKRGKSVLDCATLADTSLTSDIVMPKRLALNSRRLKLQLSKVGKFPGFETNEERNVMFPPWKYVVHYKKKIREHLAKLEKQLEEMSTQSDKAEEEVKLKVLEEQVPAVQLVSDTGDESKPDNPKVDSLDVPGSPDQDGHLNVEHLGVLGGPETSSHSLCKVCNMWGSEKHPPELACLMMTVEHLKLFVKFMDNDLKYVFDLRRGLADCTIKDIAFAELWHLFVPGDVLVSSGLKRARQAYKVFYTAGGHPIPAWDPVSQFQKAPETTPFKIDAYYINYDKRWLGPVVESITIEKFEGRRPITSLSMSIEGNNAPETSSVFPIRYLEEDSKVAIADLIKRGKRRRKLTPYSHKRYCGPSSVESPEHLNSEIIIDLMDEGLLNDLGTFRRIPIHGGGNETVDGCILGEPCFGCEDILNDDTIDRERAAEYTEDKHLLSVRDSEDEDLTDDHLMLLPHFISGFVLRERDRFGMYVDLICDLDGDEGGGINSLKQKSGFEDLVLPEGHGEIVEALVRNHRSTAISSSGENKESVQVDLIAGKGEGLIILLHGVPGVGKTSTAECVAAYTRRPLYPITCANIGLDPEEVEKNLIGPDGHFRRAQLWNCVVLLDEADVFLAKRENRDTDTKRNALVSVFLRILEYYPGILILTTNRVGAFDEAVVSRIQLFLYYPPLDQEKTMKVWQVHINRLRMSEHINIDDEDELMIMELAEEEYEAGRHWNGRQIRNFFQTAISLASYDATKRHQQRVREGKVGKDSKPDKPRLTTRTLRVVLNTSGKFIDYIKSTVVLGGHTEQQLDEGNRNDGWQETPKRKKK